MKEAGESAKVELSRDALLNLARKCIEQARENAKLIPHEAHASTLFRSAVRDAARFLGEANAGLSEVGTSIAELKSLIAQPSPGTRALNQDEIENLWKWVIEGRKN